MYILRLIFAPRYFALLLSFCLFLAVGAFILVHREWADALGVPLVLFGGLSLLGVHDLLQTDHSILRNYPIAAHLRFVLEEIRPEIRQYFFESETDGSPFSRDRRALVYQRAKMQLDKRPFGTQLNVYAEGYEWLGHSLAPRPVTKEPFRILVGGPQCAKPYSLSVLNISAMSFGALSSAAIRALNLGARKGGFAHDTGEGGFSPYHAENGGDIIWEIGSGYFGCRNNDGSFCAGEIQGRRDQSADQDGRDQTEPGRQTRARRRLAGRQGDRRNRRHSRRARGPRLHFSGKPQRLFDAARDDGFYHDAARIVGRQTDRI